MSDKTPAFPTPQAARQNALPPPNFPAVELERLLADERCRRYQAVPMPHGARVKIADGVGGVILLPVSGWAVVVTYGLEIGTELWGLGEDDAKERARLLDSRKAATGKHYWN